MVHLKEIDRVSTKEGTGLKKKGLLRYPGIVTAGSLYKPLAWRGKVKNEWLYQVQVRVKAEEEELSREPEFICNTCQHYLEAFPSSDFLLLVVTVQTQQKTMSGHEWLSDVVWKGWSSETQQNRGSQRHQVGMGRNRCGIISTGLLLTEKAWFRKDTSP